VAAMIHKVKPVSQIMDELIKDYNKTAVRMQNNANL